jgi:outer membrane receptor protein involved in Fe transport
VRLRGQPIYTGQETKRIDPTVALTYRINDGLSVYARFQTGYRTGGLAVARGVGRVAAFAGDDIIMGEVGFRMIHQTQHPLTLSGALAYARWNNIQADLFSRLGQPFTTNLGDARILTLEGNAHWEPITGFGLQAAVLYANSSVDGPIANTSVRNNRRLAQVPSVAANVGVDYSWKLHGKDRMQIAATADYFGQAVLGTGDYLDIRHPRYAVLSSSISWTHHKLTTTLSADNLLNIKADRFSLGNPLMLASRNQLTPLRPRTIRLGATIAW